MTELKQAWKNLKKMQKLALQRQQEHLEALADHYAEQRNSTSALWWEGSKSTPKNRGPHGPFWSFF